MADLEIDRSSSSVCEVIALTKAGEAFLKMWTDTEDPPEVDDCGRARIIIMADDEPDLVARAAMAGVTHG